MAFGENSRLVLHELAHPLVYGIPGVHWLDVPKHFLRNIILIVLPAQLARIQSTPPPRRHHERTFGSYACLRELDSWNISL